jgi:peptidoglycan/xylan/chitin deacetylase (PgdA/CDA1 family)
MYHSISDEPESGHPYYWINTAPARFAEHMKFLRDNNYQVISLSRAVDLIREQGSISGTQDPSFHHSSIPVFHSSSFPSADASSFHHSNIPSFQSSRSDRYVVLTFDDGYEDFYSKAFPLLKKHGFIATVFLPTSFIGQKSPGLRGKKHLTWDQVQELDDAGIAFGSHTVNHPQLRVLGWKEVDFELRASKETIEAHIRQSREWAGQSLNGPVTIHSFCYPYRFPEEDKDFCSMLSRLIRITGYTSCSTTRIGTLNTEEDVLCLKRLPVSTADDDRLFSAKLGGRYNWVAWLQGLSKKTASWRKTSPQLSLIKSSILKGRQT